MGGVVTVNIKASKTDPFKEGAQVSLVKTFCSVCPFSALFKYCTLRGRFPGPFFIHQDGSFLTKHDVDALLQGCFHSQRGISTHSFRIGGATAAAKAGVPAHVIQLLGRWRSDAFKKYVRIAPHYFRHWSSSYAQLFKKQMEFMGT